MASLQGKAAIVTGGGSGIGRATAVLFAQKGASVAVADLNEQVGKETVEMVKKAGGKAIFVKADVSQAVDVQNLVDLTVKAFGGVHVLHSNAGLMKPREAIEEVSEPEWDLVVDVSLKGSYLAARAVYPIMKKQGGGVIINMSSVGGLVPLPTGLAYGAAKAGVISFTRSLAQLGEKDNIRVNCICPSSVATHFRDAYPPEIRAKMGRQELQAEDIARAVHYLATHDTLTGTAVKVALDKTGRVEYTKVKSYDYAWESIQGVLSEPAPFARAQQTSPPKSASAG